MSTIILFPNRNRVYDIEGTHQVARAVANDIADSHTKTILLETADWSGPDTSYTNAAEFGNAPAFFADVKHKMNNPIATPISIKGDDAFIRKILIDPLTIDLDTTRVWIFAERAPPYDVLVLFVG